MNKKQRWNRKRRAKAKGKIIVRESSPPHGKNEVLSPLPKQGKRFSGVTFSGTKLVSGLCVMLALLGGYAISRPHVSVEPYVSLNPVDPYQTQFTITTGNGVSAIHDVESVCWPRKMASGNGFSIISPVPLQNVRRDIPSLEASESSTVDCPPVIGGIGAYAGDVIKAELEIDVSYKQSFWPGTETQRFPFRTMRDTNKAVHWVHTTSAEEKSILPLL